MGQSRCDLGAHGHGNDDRTHLWRRERRDAAAAEVDAVRDDIADMLQAVVLEVAVYELLKSGG